MESLSAPPLFYLPSSPPGGVLVIMVIGIIFLEVSVKVRQSLRGESGVRGF